MDKVSEFDKNIENRKTMSSRLKFLEGKEVKEEELKPVYGVGKIVIAPIIIALLFHFVQTFNGAGFLALAIFAALGYMDTKNGN